MKDFTECLKRGRAEDLLERRRFQRHLTFLKRESGWKNCSVPHFVPRFWTPCQRNSRFFQRPLLWKLKRYPWMRPPTKKETLASLETRHLKRLHFERQTLKKFFGCKRKNRIKNRRSEILRLS